MLLFSVNCWYGICVNMPGKYNEICLGKCYEICICILLFKICWIYSNIVITIRIISMLELKKLLLFLFIYI